jgi:serine/threonine-protein kinase
MALNIGTQLGSYEITALLGKGGMGEVYRARDTKLKREVAIKILPEEFLRDGDRSSRFQGEAEVLASLNHPNIGAIYDLEEANGSRFLVLELVEGETLAERIARGPIPVADALELAKQICEALEAAHERGIIHRDLKPANVKITPDGKVKVLDFGLAKVMESAPTNATLSNSPTMLSGTMGGMILGTAAYMSPEQAKGHAADQRSDIFALGCVLYETLTGCQAFHGDDVSEVLAAVLKSEPDFNLVPRGLNSRFYELLRRCLDKNSKHRWHCVGDLRTEIESVLSKPRETPVTGRRSRWVPWAVAALALIGAGTIAWLLWPTPANRAAIRLSADLGVNAELYTPLGSSVLLSPDGKLLAFVASTGNDPRRIYVRQLDELRASPLAGTEGARSPFFSPEGQRIAFFADGKLKKISIRGGDAPTTLCDAPNDRGGSWGEDGFIVFTPFPNSGLLRVSSSGGTPQSLTKLSAGELTHRWPQVIQGGRAVLYTASTSPTDYSEAGLVVESIPGGKRKVIHHGGSYGRYLPSGHLVYVQQSTLFAAPFDIKRLELTAEPSPIVEGVQWSPALSGGVNFGFSTTGSVAYVPAAAQGRYSLVWMTPDGKTEPLRSTPALYEDVRVSPDGKRVAISLAQDQFDIWVYDLQRETTSRLTSGPSQKRFPNWTPDGKHITFAASQDRAFNIYWQPADGSGEPQRLTESKINQVPTSWHPSGRFLAFDENNERGNTDVWILPMDGNDTSGWKPGKPTVLLGSPFNERYAAFSPDGHWIAYQSNEAGMGMPEIYVQPFPGPGAKFPISTTGGSHPTWSPKTKELFYRAADQKIMVVSYSIVGDSFRAGKARLWSESIVADSVGGQNTFPFDIDPNGQRFAVIKSDSKPENKFDKIVFVFNFFDELRRMASGSSK